LLGLLAWAAIGGVLAARPERAAACGSAGPFDFDTYEAAQNVATYGSAVDLAVEGKAVTFAYTLLAGDSIDLRYQGLMSGPRAARAAPSPSLRIPPSLFKSILWIESSWSNASAAVPFGGAGPVLRAPDCGYGLAQVTSGMSNETGTASGRQALIGTSFVFNIAEGVRILADKWNTAPRFRPIAGDGDPAALEDWYYAIWSYNGFAFSNHPLNPNRDPLRGGGTSPIYHCYDASSPSYQLDGSGNVVYGYGDYTYPERVYGCMRNPPIRSGGAAAQAVPRFAAGDVAVVTGTGSCMRVREAPTTASEPPLTCLPDGAEVAVIEGPASANGFTWWKVRTAHGDGWAVELYLANRARPQGSRMWQPQVFNMPNFTIEPVADAFRTENFLACEDAGFSGGCARMDFPTSFPDLNITTHSDSTAPADPGAAAAFLGSPSLTVDGPDALELVLYGDRTANSGTVVVRNEGTFVAPFRVRTSAPWLVVRHPKDAASRSLDAGVAIGQDTEVVTQSANATRPRVTQQGWDSTLIITLNPARMPPGSRKGTVWIEPLLGAGNVFEVSVEATNIAAPFENQLFAPALAAER
jgi:hypothetical protein